MNFCNNGELLEEIKLLLGVALIYATVKWWIIWKLYNTLGNENVQNIALKSPQFAFGQLKIKTKLKLGLRYLLQNQKFTLDRFFIY